MVRVSAEVTVTSGDVIAANVTTMTHMRPAHVSDVAHARMTHMAHVPMATVSPMRSRVCGERHGESCYQRRCKNQCAFHALISFLNFLSGACGRASRCRGANPTAKAAISS